MCLLVVRIERRGEGDGGEVGTERKEGLAELVLAMPLRAQWKTRDTAVLPLNCGPSHSCKLTHLINVSPGKGLKALTKTTIWGRSKTGTGKAQETMVGKEESILIFSPKTELWYCYNHSLLIVLFISKVPKIRNIHCNLTNTTFQEFRRRLDVIRQLLSNIPLESQRSFNVSFHSRADGQECLNSRC